MVNDVGPHSPITPAAASRKRSGNTNETGPRGFRIPARDAPRQTSAALTRPERIPRSRTPPTATSAKAAGARIHSPCNCAQSRQSPATRSGRGPPARRPEPLAGGAQQRQEEQGDRRGPVLQQDLQADHQAEHDHEGGDGLPPAHQGQPEDGEQTRRGDQAEGGQGDPAEPVHGAVHEHLGQPLRGVPARRIDTEPLPPEPRRAYAGPRSRGRWPRASSCRCH